MRVLTSSKREGLMRFRLWKGVRSHGIEVVTRTGSTDAESTSRVWSRWTRSLHLYIARADAESTPIARADAESTPIARADAESTPSFSLAWDAEPRSSSQFSWYSPELGYLAKWIALMFMKRGWTTQAACFVGNHQYQDSVAEGRRQRVSAAKVYEINVTKAVLMSTVDVGLHWSCHLVYATRSLAKLCAASFSRDYSYSPELIVNFVKGS